MSITWHQILSSLNDRVTHILHHSQQDLKNRVSERKIKVFLGHHSQETRFLT